MTRLDPMRADIAYRQLWRVIDGQIADAFRQHPDYLTAKGKRAARRSIAKRVTGAVLGYAAEAARGRSGSSPAVECVSAVMSETSVAAFPQSSSAGEHLAKGAHP